MRILSVILLGMGTWSLSAAELIASRRPAVEEDRVDKVREARLTWKAVSGVRRFEVELSRNAKMDPVLLRRESTRPELSLKIPAGVYFFRLRGFDSAEEPGAWSPVQGFMVNERPPQLLVPRADLEISSLLSRGELRLEWTPGLKGAKYQIEISDEQGILLNRGTKENSFVFKVPGPDTYRWKVGVEVAQGVEWSEERSFSIKPQALPPELRSRPQEIGNFSLWRFRLGGIHARQKGNADSSSGQVSLVPTLRLGRSLDLNGQVGATMFKGATKNFLALEYLLGAGIELRPFVIEAHAGFQSWLSFGVFPTAQLTLSYKLSSLVDRVYISGGRLFDDADNSAMLFKIGIGIDLDAKSAKSGRRE